MHNLTWINDLVSAEVGNVFNTKIMIESPALDWR